MKVLNLLKNKRIIRFKKGDIMNHNIKIQINEAEISKVYNSERLEEIRKHYNDLLGYEGVTKVEAVIVKRKDINRSTELQPKHYTISPDEVDRIYLLYGSYGLSLDCELQIITNQSDWNDEVNINPEYPEGELMAGFKRDRAQNKHKREGSYISDLMVYLKFYFKDKKAYRYVKTVSNTVAPNENKQPNSPMDIVVCLEDCIADGVLDEKLYQLINEKELAKEVKILTRDKSSKFRTEVINKFQAKGNKDNRFEIIYSGNLEDICSQRNLASSGKTQRGNRALYHLSNGESKNTWYNIYKKIFVEQTEADLLMYIPKPDDITKQRLVEVIKLIKSYNYFSEGDYDKISKSIKFLGFHTQKKKGLPYINGNTEVSLTNEIKYVLRTPYSWFHIKEGDTEALKEFLKKNNTDKEKYDVDTLLNQILTIYKNSKTLA